MFHTSGDRPLQTCSHRWKYRQDTWQPLAPCEYTGQDIDLLSHLHSCTSCRHLYSEVDWLKTIHLNHFWLFLGAFFNQTSKLDTRNISRLMSNPSDLNIRVLTCTSVDWHSKSISHKEGGWMGYSNTVIIYHTNKVIVLASSFSSFFHDSKLNVFMCLKMLLENETGVFNTQQIKRNKELS